MSPKSNTLVALALALSLALSSCGRPTEFKAGVTRSKRLGDLTAAERQRACSSSRDLVEDQQGEERAIRLACAVQAHDSAYAQVAVAGGRVVEPTRYGVACRRSLGSCLAERAAQAERLRGTGLDQATRGLCRPVGEDCVATVGEAEGCARGISETLGETLTLLEACEPSKVLTVGSAILVGSSTPGNARGRLELVSRHPACLSVARRCPGFPAEPPVNLTAAPHASATEPDGGAGASGKSAP